MRNLFKFIMKYLPFLPKGKVEAVEAEVTERVAAVKKEVKDVKKAAKATVKEVKDVASAAKGKKRGPGRPRKIESAK